MVNDVEWDEWNAEYDEKLRIKAEKRAARRLKNNTPAAKKAASERGKARQKQGEKSEKLAKKVLELMGYVYIKRVKTYYSHDGNYAHKAEADWRAISPTGLYTLVEVKDIEGDRLTFSRLEKHQVKNLNSVQTHNGVSLLIITHKKRFAVLEWPVLCAGKNGDSKFEKRTSVLFEYAMKNSIYRGEI